jgi:hypothetical protein
MIKGFNNGLAFLNAMYLLYDDEEVFTLAGVSHSYIKWYMEEKHGASEEKVFKEVIEVESVEVKKNGFWDEFKLYSQKVWFLTECQNIKSLEFSERRAFYWYHLDHKASIYFGFRNNVPAKNIAHISNLHFIPSEENMKKGRKCFWDHKNEWIRAMAG